MPDKRSFIMRTGGKNHHCWRRGDPNEGKGVTAAIEVCGEQCSKEGPKTMDASPADLDKKGKLE